MSPSTHIQHEHPKSSLLLSLALIAGSSLAVIGSGALSSSGQVGEALWLMAVALLANLAIVFWDARNDQLETGSGFIPIVIAALAYGPGAAFLTAVASGLPFVALNPARAIRRIATRVLSGISAAFLFEQLQMSNHDINGFILMGFLCAALYQTLQLLMTGSLVTIEFGGSLLPRVRAMAPQFALGFMLFGPMAVAYAYLVPAAPEAILVATFALLASHQLLVTVQRSRGFERMLSTMSAEIPGSLLAALDAADSYTAQHSAAVASYAYDIASACGYEQRRARQVHAAALLHDVGKIGVPEHVLTKPGRLNQEEWEMIQKHPELGANMVARIPGFEVLEPGIRHHHERIDGSGYPDGVAGDAIPEEAQIIAVADTYSAITTTRSYRKAQAPEYGMSELIKDGENRKLNDRLVQLFVNHLRHQPLEYQTGTHTTLGEEVSKVRGWLDLFAGNLGQPLQRKGEKNTSP